MFSPLKIKKHPSKKAFLKGSCLWKYGSVFLPFICKCGGESGGLLGIAFSYMLPLQYLMKGYITGKPNLQWVCI